MLAAIDVNMGNVLDVVHLNTSCPACKKLEDNNINGTMPIMEFLKAFLAHKDSCKLNHEGSASVMI